MAKTVTAVRTEGGTNRQPGQVQDREVVLYLDPHAVQVPSGPNRAAYAFKDEDYEQLVASIRSAGRNVTPVTVRRIGRADDGDRFELVFGERRLRACQEANVPVRAVLAVDGTTEEVPLDGLRENLGRKNLSPLEFGIQLKFYLERNPTIQQAQLARMIGCSGSNVSRALDLASLPGEVLRAFREPTELRYEDMKPLRDAWRKNAEAVKQEAECLRGEAVPVPTKAAVKRLMKAAAGDLHDANDVGPVSTGRLEYEGRELGRWRVPRDGGLEVHLTLKMSEVQGEALLQHVAAYLARTVLKRSGAGRLQSSERGRELQEVLARQRSELGGDRGPAEGGIQISTPGTPPDGSLSTASNAVADRVGSEQETSRKTAVGNPNVPEH